MSLMTFIGRERNLLDESPEHCRQLKLAHPILTNEDVVRLRANEHPDLAVATVDATWVPDAEDLAGSLQRGIDALVQASVTALQNGAVLLIISDRQADVTRAGIPILLATAAVHQGLIHRGLRSQAGLIIETGEAREVMHFCLLCGFGASAINPYLAMEAIDELKRRVICRMNCRWMKVSTTTLRRSRRASSRRCPRWASRPCAAIDTRDCSKRSASINS
jgi:glutamate synthase (NADPH/NADH) large chain